MYKILLTLLLSLQLSSLVSAPLIVGTNAEFPPFTYMENKTIVGFDIDVAKEVAKRLGREIEFKDMPFDALIPEVILGRVDFVAAGMSYTDERAKRVLFTQPYLKEDPLVIFSKENLSLGDLKGKTVIVIEGYTADFFMSSIAGVNLIRLPTQADGFMALKSNRADALVTAKSTLNAFLEVQNESSFHISELKDTGEAYALVVPQKKPQMLTDVQKALDEMIKDGTLDKLKTKWKL